ncbi:hypothetical protein C2G38_2235604 [Gigaspora rosea]|uniref:Uncharacterized protein n=1 Tax=Gigaspora rosea TaxID=44941 RepID=A0A397TRP9_9GLOM|nr:hypothetical protein C2G38_2235604 [Gigaspora rosea]
MRKPTTNDKKRRYDALEKLAEKFDKSPNKTLTQKDSTETEKETHQEQNRAKRLRTAMNEVRADLNTNDKHSDKPNNPIEHNRTGEPSNEQFPPRFENSTGDLTQMKKPKAFEMQRCTTTQTLPKE